MSLRYMDLKTEFIAHANGKASAIEHLHIVAHLDTALFIGLFIGCRRKVQEIS